MDPQKSSFSKKLTNTFGKKGNIDQGGTVRTNLLLNQQSQGFEEAQVTEYRHTGQDIFRRQHPSLIQDNQNSGCNSKPLMSFGGAQLNLTSASKIIFKPNVSNNIFRQSNIKRDLSDMHSDKRFTRYSLMPPYSPKSGKSPLGLQQEEQSTSKPRYNQTAVRNPTMQNQALLNQRTPLIKQNEGLQSNLSYVSPNVRVKKDDNTSLTKRLDKATQDRNQLTSQQFHAAQKAVTSRLNEQFTLSDDISINDIDLQLQKFPNKKVTANYTPFAFFPTQSIKIPDQIYEIANGLKDWKVEMSKRNKVIYFGIGNKLIVWNYDQQMNQGVMRSLQNNNNQYKMRAINLQSSLVVIG